MGGEEGGVGEGWIKGRLKEHAMGGGGVSTRRRLQQLHVPAEGDARIVAEGAAQDAVASAGRCTFLRERCDGDA
jgi:hypothetical protein